MKAKLPFKLSLTALAAISVTIAFILVLGIINFNFIDSSPSQPEITDGPPIVLVSIDTFRADRVSASGYDRDITPNLDEFIDDAYYFENTYANAPWTFPSHSTVFTGKYPSETGALHINYRICSDEETLTETLNDSGYNTAGFTGSGPISQIFGFSQGFDTWDESGDHSLYVDKVPEALNFLEDRSSDQFFLFLHGFDVHSPFVVQSEPVKYGGNFSEEIPVTWEEMREMRENNKTWTDLRTELNTSKGSPILEDWIDLYDSSILEMDQSLGRLFDELEEEGLYDDALIIVMSDHGEEFREHGHLGHAQFYSETINVPLAVKLPEQHEGQHIEDSVEIRDIYATILSEVGLEPDRAVPLQDVVEGNDRHETIFSERQGKKMIVNDGYKLVWTYGEPFESEEYKLYNLEEDPYENNDISDDTETVEEIKENFNSYPQPRPVEERCIAETDFAAPEYIDNG